MQVVKYGLIFVLIFYFAFLLLAPKRELYYLLEKELYKSGIIIDSEELQETPIGIELKHPSIIYQGIKVAKAKEIKLVTLVFYTQATISGIEDSSGLKSFFPIMPNTIVIDYNIVKFNRLNITVFGDFGEAKGYYDLSNNILHIDFFDDTKISSIKRYLKKAKNGWYYEERF